MPDKEILTKFSECVYGCPIVLKATRTPDTKLACGENGQMSITAGDEIIMVDLKNQQIYKWTAEFDWGEDIGCAPWGFSCGDICFIGKI